MADKVRYGVISTARIARKSHIPAAAKTTNCEIVAIASRDQSRAEHWAGELDIPRAYGSYAELLDDPDVDAVINATPNSLHAEWTVRAAEAGKHILCEKPFAMTVEEADGMIAAARDGGVLLMEAFRYRFHPQVPFVRETIDSGEVGELRLTRVELLYTIQDWAGDSRVKPGLGGGCLMDAGCYTVNLTRFLMGAEPVRVQAFERRRAEPAVDTTFAGLMEFPGDRLAYVATGMEEPFRFTCEVIGSEGTIRVAHCFAGGAVTVESGGQEKVREFDGIDQFQAQLEHFSDCILSGTPPMLPVEDARGNTAALVALRRAAAEGRAIDV